MSSIREMALKIWGNSHITVVHTYSKTTKLVLGSLLGGLAAVLQSAGMFAGIGYAFSILTTGPIVLATILSLRIGLMTYVLTVFLLFIMQPSELIIFPFTTGLLGISLGISFNLMKSSLSVALCGGICLTIGTLTVLYGFQFPLLGPSVTSEWNVNTLIGVLAFSLLYSWIWMRLSVICMKRLNQLMVSKQSS